VVSDVEAEFAIGEGALVKPAAAPFAIAGREIGSARPPFVIAELSGNHNGSLDQGFRLIDAAAGAGADAIKLQTYTPDTITLDDDGPDFRIRGGLWDGLTLHALYRDAHTPYEWQAALFEHARARGLIVFSSPFDDSAIDLLEGLDAPAYKIASFEAVDLPLIARAAATGKPLIVSTGMTAAREIAEALAVARACGTAGVALLHCVSEYPAPVGAANLRMIPRLAEDFGCLVGLSDHTPGTAAAVAAVALGACIVEKHFTLRRADGGPDAAFSLEPHEFAQLTADCRNAWEALGEASYRRSAGEAANRQFRRSLYVVRDVAAGAVITPADVRSIRPGFGLAPKHLPEVLGRRAARALKRGERFDWEMVE
jgi:N-acetylneuraminate synthase